MVCAIGAAGWAIAWRAGLWKPTLINEGNEGNESTRGNLRAEMLGYFSAVCYLG